MQEPIVREEPGVQHEDALAAIMGDSWDANYHIWQRNLQGAPYSLNEEIRRIAETRYGEKPFRILEITRGMPLKAIDLAGKSFRRYGDMLEYGDSGKHPVPKFSTTVVSPDDYVLKFLQREADDTKAHLQELLELVCTAFDSSLSSLLSVDKKLARLEAQNVYQAERRSGRMNLIQSDYSNVVSVVDGLVEQGKQYDLVFLDTEGIMDLPTFLQSVQHVLAEGGIAYVPLTWWSPKWEGGVDKRTLIDRAVIEQLLVDDPQHFLISNFPEASTLIIKGSQGSVERKPLQQNELINYRTDEELEAEYQSVLTTIQQLEDEKTEAEKRVAVTQLLFDRQRNVENVTALIDAEAELSKAKFMLELAIKKRSYLGALKDAPSKRSSPDEA